jgi:serine/threonine protein kinase
LHALTGARQGGTPASDIYSLGVVMWEIFTERLPFGHIAGMRTQASHSFMDAQSEKKGSELISSIATQDLRPVTDGFEWPDNYKALMQRMWHSSSERRPAIAEVVRRLERLLDAEDKEATMLRRRKEWEPISMDQLKIGKLLGKGAAGDVHEASWNGNQCAVKSFFASTKSDFNAELNVLHRLRHPNIVNFFGACMGTDDDGTYDSRVFTTRDSNDGMSRVFTTDDTAVTSVEGRLSQPPPTSQKRGSTCLIVMELCAIDLYRHLQKYGKLAAQPSDPSQPATAKLHLATRVRYALDAAKAMVFLHNHQIIHHDLKSSNLLISNDKARTVKICDFSLSHATQGSFDARSQDAHSVTGSVVSEAIGTASYLAPEKLQYHLRAISMATEVLT